MKILLADDDPVSLMFTEEIIRKLGLDVITASNGKDAMDSLLAPDGPKLAVLDWKMPEMSGIEICRKIRAMEDGDYYYLALLSVNKGKRSVLEGFEAGADDYMVKPVNSSELKMRIRCGERVVRLEQELLKTQERLRDEATHDALTGLMNKGALIETLEREEARLERRPEENLAVVMVDLDHFKSINDTYGHAAGDTVLRVAGQRMAESARGYDVVGRYGGEEFLIILPNCSLEDAAVQAERLRQLIGGEPIDFEDGRLRVTASLGVAASDISCVGNPDELIKRADQALYMAKKNGRNRVEVADYFIPDGAPVEDACM